MRNDYKKEQKIQSGVGKRAQRREGFATKAGKLNSDPGNYTAKGDN